MSVFNQKLDGDFNYLENKRNFMPVSFIIQ